MLVWQLPTWLIYPVCLCLYLACMSDADMTTISLAEVSQGNTAQHLTLFSAIQHQVAYHCALGRILCP